MVRSRRVSDTKQYEKHLHKKILVCVVLFACISSFFTSVTLSRYSSTYAAQDISRVASYVFKAEIVSNGVQNMKPGDTSNLLFDIKNFDSSISSEVKIKYKVKVEIPNISVPITYNLYKVVNGVDTLVTLTNDETAYQTFTSSNLTDRYKLVINWPSSYKNISYANISDYIKITASAVQTD